MPFGLQHDLQTVAGFSHLGLHMLLLLQGFHRASTTCRDLGGVKCDWREEEEEEDQLPVSLQHSTDTQTETEWEWMEAEWKLTGRDCFPSAPPQTPGPLHMSETPFRLAGA